jgi:tRNA-specific 2-thiouridylase
LKSWGSAPGVNARFSIEIAQRERIAAPFRRQMRASAHCGGWPTNYIPAMNSLGFDAAPADTRVVVAMSGGVDSAVTAATLRRAGYDVVGITLQLYNHGEAVGRAGTCCAGRDIHDARRVAQALDMPHYVLDYENQFRAAVIDDFVATYRAGLTPVPCVRCNQKVKFRDLLATAKELGAVALATGHYARRVAGPGGPELHRARDHSRDQSYFLFATTPAQLDYVRFPLGGMTKQQVRAAAREWGLPVAEKPDSQDICFVPTGGYAAVIERLQPGAAEPGEFVDRDGRVLGRHPGVIHFTVGQRRGLGLISGAIGDPGPLYVVRIDAAQRRVVVGPRTALACDRFRLDEFNWLGGQAPSDAAFAAEVRMRSAQPLRPASVRLDGGTAEVRLDAPDQAVAPGQAGVIYQGDRVLGGGWIAASAATAVDS